MLEVHLVPHSHTDPGWLHTFDKYYFMSVERILDEVLTALEASPQRTFTWAETCFFARWFDGCSDGEQARVRSLVRTGQLSFVGGGWVMHDEALTNPHAMAMQMAEGHTWLRDNLNVTVHVGWQIDPFGHSTASAAVLAACGLSSQVIHRVHHVTKKRWREEKRLEFEWEVAPDQSLLTHVLYDAYTWPTGYDLEFQHKQGDPPSSYPAKVETAASGLSKLLLNRSAAYMTDVMMLPAGGDFRWDQAGHSFAFVDDVIRRINDEADHLVAQCARATGPTRVSCLKDEVRLVYSTPDRYFAALRRQPRFSTPPRWRDDLLPYADKPADYWTGFYTTRPALKALVPAATAAVVAAEWTGLAARQAAEEVAVAAVVAAAMVALSTAAPAVPMLPTVFSATHLARAFACSCATMAATGAACSRLWATPSSTRSSVPAATSPNASCSASCFRSSWTI
mmetsp:Transcript_52426/g.114317  ORF Transcript_52426/g.114317 Transcript_52426/m.114317 type:complete len:452 (-) Transcript_52426:1463-2818(-)